MALGKAARTAVPRSSHADFEPSPTRPDPVALLEEQATSRVQELVPIRYGRMLVSPFTFYRGAALIMASDLAGTPRSGLTVQACGDAHLSNFGVFASAERTLVFDVNDFDETLPGPWEWDLKRLAASMVVAGRERGFSDTERIGIVRGTAEAYRTEMAKLAEMSDLDVWYSRMDITKVLADLGQQLKLGGDKGMTKAKARAEKQQNPGPCTNAADTDHLACHLDEPKLLEEVLPVALQCTPIALQELVDRLGQQIALPFGQQFLDGYY